MSETADRRRRTDLDLFVLALIESGLSTPYQLQKEAGLSQGATIPTLQRLSEAGFVRQGRSGPRGRADYKITAIGKRTLRNGWRALVQGGPSGDLDSDLRVALLALSVGGDRGLAVDFLRHSAARKLESTNTFDRLEDSTQVAPVARWYRVLRLAAARTLFEAESAAALNMAESLPRTLAGKFRRQSGVARKSAGA